MADKIKKDGEAALLSLSSLLATLTSLISASFASKPSVVFKDYLAEIATDIGNGKVKDLKDNVVDITDETVTLLEQLKVWVRLMVPRIEDGGNFGVGIQMALIKQVGEELEKMTKLFEDMATYHEKRVLLVEKMVSKEVREAKDTTIAEAIEKDKTGTSKEETKRVVTPTPLSEQSQALAALDLKFYLAMKSSVIKQRNFLAAVHDYVEKNKAKLKDPRGSAGSSYSYSY